MCGIFGIINNSNSASIDKSKFTESAHLMQHRGPDAYGQWGLENRIELAHLRLSIIDLNPESNQPFISNCGNFVIVFNGEIFNYLELKNELITLGYSFRTRSDTEVLLNSYIEWGPKCVSKFNGDWAFSIYNIKENSLFCSRDRFGVKPFNYALFNNQLIYSSEIKSILNYFPQLRDPNYNVIANYCRNSLGAQIEQTWFNEIKRLLPAHNLFWKDGQFKIEKYWNYPKAPLTNISLTEATQTYRELFINAVKLRMRSDVPVGTTLSSGIDSSSIVSVLRKFYYENHKTFTAVFNPEDFHKQEKTAYKGNIIINEGLLVKKLALDLNLEPYFINNEEINLVEDLSGIIYHLESGHSSYATLPISKVLNYAKNHVTVVMEGQGADEMLGGYVISMFPALEYELFKHRQIKQLVKELALFNKSYSLSYTMKQFLRMLNNDRIERLYQLFMGINKVFGPRLKKYCRIKDYPLTPPAFKDSFNKTLFKLHTGGLVNLLHYGDAISMSKSMESRNPFMDVNLVEFAFNLSYNYKMHNGLGKYIHREAMKGIVPDYILNNPLKFGFNTPLHLHFNSFSKESIQILLSDQCLERGIFDREGLLSLINQHIENRKNNSTILFRLLSVELWFRIFID